MLKVAMSIRAKGLYSEYQIREKLYSKEASKKVVDYVIKTMKDFELINDNMLANDYLEYYNSLNYGKNKILHKLSEKGIFEVELNKLKFPESLEKKKAKNILKKLENKYAKYNDNQKKQHIYNAYIAYGFDSHVASEMINEVTSNNKSDELTKLNIDYQKTKLRLSRKYEGKELKQKIINNLLTKGYRLNDIIKIIN